MIKILFIIGLVFLSFNILRFIIGNYAIFKSKEIKWYLKVWNLIESIGITVVYILLVIKYYE
jgi:hypothetical protein